TRPGPRSTVRIICSSAELANRGSSARSGSKTCWLRPIVYIEVDTANTAVTTAAAASNGRRAPGRHPISRSNRSAQPVTASASATIVTPTDSLAELLYHSPDRPIVPPVPAPKQGSHTRPSSASTQPRPRRLHRQAPHGAASSVTAEAGVAHRSYRPVSRWTAVAPGDLTGPPA